MNNLKKIGDFWSKQTIKSQKNKGLKLRWWQSPFIIRHVNARVSGKKVDGLSQGLVDKARLLLKQTRITLPLKKGISVGCGNGLKEIRLIQQKFVDSFDLFELSKVRINAGKQLAQKLGLETNLSFILGNAFEIVEPVERYDLVYWNNSLHHMLDVDKALRWSRSILKDGGLFFMDDYVGPSRFQWSDKMLKIATEVRQALNKRFLKHPRVPAMHLPAFVTRPDANKLFEKDPSEAADSERIMSAVRKYFPNAEITITGGVIYHLALSDALNNFDEKKIT
jgi:SAM-dependent methyltransferase